MFESGQFRIQLEEVVRTTAATGIMGYTTELSAVLRFLAMVNEDPLMLTENERPLEHRRGIPEAMESARNLVREASTIARDRGAVDISVDDLADAYRNQFCNVWPFCR